MRWYVMHEGKTAGPVDGEDIFQQGREGRLFPSMHVRDEGGVWMPILQSPFASVVSLPAVAAPPPVSFKRIAIGVPIAFVLLVVCVLLAAAFSSSKPTTTSTPIAPAAAVTREPVKQREPGVGERLAKASTLSEAIRLTRPFMGDVQGEDANQGAALLAVWWGQHSDLWPELTAMPDSKRAEVLKDPEPYRGQRICMTGSVTQIFRDKSSLSSSPIYMGVLYHNGGFVRFVTAQSTQGVVENTPARFCGIVIGLQSYSNVSGGTTHAIQVVGLFDIPANGGKGLPQYDEW